jgi:endoglucanase
MFSLRSSLRWPAGAAVAFARGFTADVLTANSDKRNTGRVAPRLLLLAAVLLGSLFAFASPASAKTAMQAYVEAMQPGTNYGNTYDALPNETSWGNAAITPEYAQALVAQGYKSIRMTVTWADHIGSAPSYTIDPAWMNKIQQAVDISLNAGLYVMLNVHHDSWSWISGYGTDPVGVQAKFDAVWTQIATQFKDYPAKLSFESVNEPGFKGADGNDLPDATMATLLDQLNTDFVHLVRNSGGNNGTRPLVLPTVYTRADQPMLDSLKTTITNLNDPNLIATIHYYGWWPFSVNNTGYTTFNQLPASWVQQPFDAAYHTFVASGIPVIIGEFGVLAGNNIEHGELLKYYEYVIQYAGAKGMTHMLWDTGGIFGRSDFQWRDAELAAIMKQAWTHRATTAASDLLFVHANAVRDAVINLNLNGNSFVSLTDGFTTLTRDVDYKLQGSILTIKASRLAQYAVGSFGEKAVLAVNVNSGPAWNIHVRYVDSPVLSAATGTNGSALVIPTAFNGDVLAAMEATFADGTPAGPLGWTQFKGWGDFLPDYTHNAIKITANFFKDVPAGIINLKFYFWSGQTVSYQLDLHPKPPSAGSDWVVSENGLGYGWYDWGWTSYNINDATVAHSEPTSISMTPGAYGGLVLQTWAGMDTSNFHTLVFWIHGGSAGGQSVGVGVTWGSWPGVSVPTPKANTWQKVEIPLSSLGVDGVSNLGGIYFQNWSGGNAPTFYIDDIRFTTAYASWLLEITGTPVAATPPVTTFAVKGHGIHLDNRTNRVVQTVQVLNIGSQPVTGPIYLVLDGLSLSTTLLNATGSTENVIPAGSPYITVTTAGLAPGGTATVTLEFGIPTPDVRHTEGGYNLNVTYTPRVLSGGTVP